MWAPPPFPPIGGRFIAMLGTMPPATTLGRCTRDKRSLLVQRRDGRSDELSRAVDDDAGSLRNGWRVIGREKSPRRGIQELEISRDVPQKDVGKQGDVEKAKRKRRTIVAGK